MSSWLLPYTSFFITHLFNLIRNYLLQPVTPSFENILFPWLPGAWPSPCLLNIAAPFHFYWFLCPFSPSFSLSVGVCPVLCWFLPHSLLSQKRYRHPSHDFACCFCNSCFLFLPPYFCIEKSHLSLESQFKSHLLWDDLVGTTLCHQRQSRALPTLSPQNSIMICVCVWFPHSEWGTSSEISLPHLQLGLPWWLRGKESTCQCRRYRFDPWVRKIPRRRKWQSTPVFLPGESHGQRNLAG